MVRPVLHRFYKKRMAVFIGLWYDESIEDSMLKVDNTNQISFLRGFWYDLFARG